MQKGRDYKRVILERLHHKVDDSMKKSIGSSVQTQQTPNPKNNFKQLCDIFDHFEQNFAVIYDPIHIDKKPLKRNLAFQLLNMEIYPKEKPYLRRVLTQAPEVKQFKIEEFQTNPQQKCYQIEKDYQRDNRESYIKGSQYKQATKISIQKPQISRHKSLKMISVPSVKKFTTQVELKSLDYAKYNGITNSDYNNDAPTSTYKRSTNALNYEIKRKQILKKIPVPSLRRCDSFKL